MFFCLRVNGLLHKFFFFLVSLSDFLVHGLKDNLPESVIIPLLLLQFA